MIDGQLKEVAEKISDRVKLKMIIDSAISGKKVRDMLLVTMLSSLDIKVFSKAKNYLK